MVTDSTISQILRIREADFADIPVIQEIAKAAWTVAYKEILTPEFMAHELEREYGTPALQSQMSELAHCFLLAETTDTLAVGFASYSLIKPESTDNTTKSAMLHKLYLAPTLKGRGFGAHLMDAIATRAKENGGTQLLLKVNRSNPAVTFYQKQGFTILREEDVKVGPGFWRNDYVMSKAL